MRESVVVARRRGTGRAQLMLTLTAALVILACTVQAGPGASGIGCASTNCPPPARSQRAAPQTAHAQGFSVSFFPDQWNASTPDARTVELTAQTNFGDLTVQFFSTNVGAGTSAQALLTTAVNNLDTSQLSGLQDAGPIYGAAIGYVSGAGTTYTATFEQPNAPSVPVYLEIMASVHGTLGIVFLAASTLDPNGADPTDPRQVPNADYDQMVNSLTWQ